MKFKTTGHCEMFVQGIDMTCPLCQTLVRSGERHECKAVAPANPGRPPERKAALEQQRRPRPKR